MRATDATEADGEPDATASGSTQALHEPLHAPNHHGWQGVFDPSGR